MSPPIRLLRPTIEQLDAALAGDEQLAEALGALVAPDWVSFAEALPSARETVAENPDDPWGPRLFLTEDPPELVGWGGFKGAPRDGVVELGYEIAASRRERGLATAAARAMVAEAFADPEVTSIVAHTLPERNASNRVLERVGFRFAEATKEGEQAVWRYELARSLPTQAAP